MALMGDFKNPVALIGAIKPRLVEAAREAKVRHFGRPECFKEQTKRVHQAFDAFATELGASPSEAAKLRKLIGRQITEYPQLSSLELQILTQQIPLEFCVRGEWVSARAEVVMH